MHIPLYFLKLYASYVLYFTTSKQLSGEFSSFSSVLSEVNSSESESSMFKSVLINFWIDKISIFFDAFIIFNDYIDVIIYFFDENPFISGNLILFK